MELDLKYGTGTIRVHIPESAQAQILEPNQLDPVDSVEQELTNVLFRLGASGPSPTDRLGKGAMVAIAIPDETRPLPVKKIMPALLSWLFGTQPELDPAKVTIVVGGGLHPPLDQTTLNRLVPPEIAGDCLVIGHDANQSPMVDYGHTSRGTPVRINAQIAEADYKIVVGQIDPHQFVGFTGGSKGIIIGCGSSATIEHNHSLMFHDRAQVGIVHGNPVREDLNEAGEMVGIDLAVNFIMAPSKEVVQVLAGDPLQMLLKGAATCAALYGVEIEEKFDIVVASCGGYPKDICLYQAQKGLNLASQAVKKGGHILLLAASSQGVGDDVYFDYVSQFTSPEEVLTDFKKQGFRMGAHKAYLFGRTLNEFDVAVSSELDAGVLHTCQLRAADPSKVVGEWVDNFQGTPRVGVIPNANTTYFYRRGIKKQ
ncbi:MAG: nickel-dependent lactate racemase [Desulfofustis sp.]|nr:nickel-dependent lactate racemase [Desulfofustis sp.]